MNQASNNTAIEYVPEAQRILNALTNHADSLDVLNDRIADKLHAILECRESPTKDAKEPPTQKLDWTTSVKAQLNRLEQIIFRFQAIENHLNEII